MNGLISIEKTAEKILTRAIVESASDIHIFFRGEGPLIQFRIDNRLVPQETLSFFEAERLIAHLKFLASMDIGEKRRPQSGAIIINLANQVVGLRLSTLPAAYLESLVIRSIPQHPSSRTVILISKHRSKFDCTPEAFPWHAHIYRYDW
ncbi:MULTISPECIES: ATPase, T2SS/T4P/T4SS family [unclassified Bacillus (in: firmicutes)]|uniref:ATPase, T2SS/T4P/T4SS family n=1 Tax=unclassified Bacillus (in: firmicutes) TaxID=185979 RepID=UPI001BE57202|nr:MULTISPECIES: ATPase, T2SS/T4P/T4SS family [unclassified Bacillus (in: firmicutes)]MBT2618111.1 Flp pilus assembly complex ATPase component TadA [Bacillus sp. ISL-78]MBT2629633.1 Flp pilus assembly complex ATPase component TadA [Bacillus sp. ISL-101]MBT2718807.1 Flp pilus assembly complex ATPase component TadA [Bacillus sp. ISL-57]